MNRATTLLITLLLASSVAAHAADGGACSAEGVTVLTDPAGDCDGAAGSTTGVAGACAPDQDLLAVSLGQPGDDASKLTFTIQVASFPPALQPNAAWFTSFYGPDENTIYGVRMQTDSTGAPQYFSYLAGGNTSGGVDGRFVGTSLAAQSGSFTADGKITIVIKASDVGVNSSGQTLSGFNAASLAHGGATVGTTGVNAIALDVDDAQAGLLRGDAVYAVNMPCGGGKSGLLGLGTLQLPALLILGGLAALRRRAR